MTGGCRSDSSRSLSLRRAFAGCRPRTRGVIPVPPQLKHNPVGRTEEMARLVPTQRSMNHSRAMLCRRLIVLGCLLCSACGDDPGRAPRDAGTRSDSSVIRDGGTRRDAAPLQAHDHQADSGAGDSSMKSMDARVCPASGLPAFDGCPCMRPIGDYCCGIGYGVTCTDAGIWHSYIDGPCGQCTFLESDGGLVENCEIRAEVVECR